MIARNDDIVTAYSNCRLTVGSKQLPKLVHSEPSIFRDATHGKRLNGIVAWDGDLADAIAHDDVLSLPNDLKAGLFKSADGIEMMNPRDFRHGLQLDFHIAHLGVSKAILQSGQILANRVLNVGDRFFHRVAFRPTTRQRRDGDADALVGSVNRNLVVHDNRFPVKFNGDHRLMPTLNSARAVRVKRKVAAHRSSESWGSLPDPLKQCLKSASRPTREPQ